MKPKAWRNLINQPSGLICCICGLPIVSRKECSREHEPPLSRGGKKSQWRYACKKCNNRKGALTAQEYAVWLELEHRRNGR
jgi:5-methylcytosine-specific restriction endonuclease McrA